MKKISVLIVLLSISLCLQAQNDRQGSGAFSQVINGDGWLRPDGSGNVSSRQSNGGGDIGGNIIKVKLDGILNSKYGLGYERVLSRKFTFGIDGLYQLPTKSTSFSEDFGLSYDLLSDNLADQQGGLTDIFVPANYGFTGSETSRFYVMPEVRFYFKEAPRGLYAGLYLKYRSLDYTNNLQYQDDFVTGPDTEWNFDFNFKMNTMSGGLALGMQTFLLKRVSLDLVFFGIQYGSNIGSVEMLTKGDALSADIQSDVEAGVNYINANLPIVENIFQLIENTPERIFVESRFSSPSIQLPSVRLGIRF